MNILAFVLTSLVVLIIYLVFFRKQKVAEAVLYNNSPVSMAMAVHHENAKFRIRYRNLDPTQELYRIGLRDGQFGVIVRHNTGMYAKTTVKGKCYFVRIQAYNYTPTGS